MNYDWPVIVGLDLAVDGSECFGAYWTIRGGCDQEYWFDRIFDWLVVHCWYIRP